jgi:hypothetical protein
MDTDKGMDAEALRKAEEEDMQRPILRTEGMSEGDFETLIGYEFQQDGFHRGRVYLKTADALERYMREVVAPAFREGREMMITDSDDNAVFHVKDAVVLHAGGADTRAMATLLTQLGDAPTWREGWKARHGIERPRHRPHRTTEPPEQEQRHGQRYGR